LTKIEPFDREARHRYIADATARAGQPLPAWALERVTSIDGLSVRTLQGVANNAIMLARNNRLTHETLDAMLGHAALLQALPAARTPRDVIEEIAQHFSTTFDDIAGRSRQGAVTTARAVIAFVLQERGHSHSAIAEMLGKRERTTIRDLAQRGQSLIAADEGLRRRFIA
jgi:chromosomal replication initiation ATPase DnaA